MHPQIGTGRAAGDARRVDQVWQMDELGLGNIGPVDIARAVFQDGVRESACARAREFWRVSRPDTHTIKVR